MAGGWPNHRTAVASLDAAVDARLDAFLARYHVRDPYDWANEVGTDYWIAFQDEDLATRGGASGWLAASGWTTVSAASSYAGDFLSSSDNDPYSVESKAHTSPLTSPPIFGDYARALAAKQISGVLPTKLTVDIYARFTTHSADEDALDYAAGSTHFGLKRPGAASGVAIVTDGTNFRLTDGTNFDNGAAIDSAWHLFTIEITASTITWYMDGVSQGTLTTPADVWPMALSASHGTTNRFRLAWAHLYWS